MRARHSLIYDTHGNGNRAKIYMIVMRDFENNSSFTYLEAAQLEFKLTHICRGLVNLHNSGIGNSRGKFVIWLIRRVNFVAIFIEEPNAPLSGKSTVGNFEFAYPTTTGINLSLKIAEKTDCPNL